MMQVKSKNSINGYIQHHFSVVGFVYVLKSILNSELYIGSTNNLRRRIVEHNQGKHISTRRYMPWRLIYYEAYASESLARLREKRLKSHGNAVRELKKRIGILPQNSRPKSGAGYTLIELLISMSIFGILASITVFGFRGVGKANLLKQTSAELVANLRMIQSLATTGGSVMTCGNITPLKACSAEKLCTSGYCDTPASPPGGYGIVINVDANGYTMFAHMRKLGGTYIVAEYNAALDPVVKLGNVKTNKDVTIMAYKPSLPTIPFYTPTAVTFTTPRGLTNMDVVFCISHKDLPNSKSRISLIKDTGQLLEENVTACP